MTVSPLLIGVLMATGGLPAAGGVHTPAGVLEQGPVARPGYTLVDAGYNGEMVELPSYYWERAAGLHAKLKERLAPADYAEILKGEYAMFLGIRYCFDDTVRLMAANPDLAPEGGVDSYFGDIRTAPAPVLQKLERILQNPEEQQAFARCRFLTETHEGCFYRGSLEDCREGVVFADERYIITRTRGLTAGSSSIHTFWDSRTLTKAAAFSTPVSIYGCARCGDSPVYDFVAEEPDSICDSSTGTYWYSTLSSKPEHTLVAPAEKVFQTFHGGTEWLEGDIATRTDEAWTLNRTIPEGGLYRRIGRRLPQDCTDTPDLTTGRLEALRLAPHTSMEEAKAAGRRLGRLRAVPLPPPKDGEWTFLPQEGDTYGISKSKDGKDKVADLYLLADGGYAIVLPNGHFAGTPGCASKLGFTDREAETSMDSLAPWRNRPEEVWEALGGEADDIAALRQATRHWLTRLGYDPDDMPDEPTLADLPEASVALPALSQQRETLPVEVELTAKDAPIEDLIVHADGHYIPQSDESAFKVAAGSKKKVMVEVPLTSGQTWIEATPVDADGLVGATQRFRVVNNIPAPSDLFVVAVGVSAYGQEGIVLPHAAKDAHDVAETFRRLDGNVWVLTLTDDEFQDASALEKIRNFLAAATEEDRIVLYFASGCMLDDKLDYYLAPAGFDPEAIPETGVSMDALAECLATPPARKKLLMLDARHIGTAGEEDAHPLSGDRQSKVYMESMFANDDELRGINVLSCHTFGATAPDESEEGNGVFASAVIKALTEGRANVAYDYFTVADLEAFVAQEVQQATGGKLNAHVDTREGAVYFNLAKKGITPPPPSEPEPVETPAQPAEAEPTPPAPQAVEAPDTRSAENLLQEGLDYANGRHGKRVDFKQAKRLYEAAAVLGNAEAMYYLARLHRFRLDDDISDPAQAPAWYKKAADLGHARAKAELKELK